VDIPINFPALVIADAKERPNVIGMKLSGLERSNRELEMGAEYE